MKLKVLTAGLMLALTSCSQSDEAICLAWLNETAEGAGRYDFKSFEKIDSVKASNEFFEMYQRNTGSKVYETTGTFSTEIGTMDRRHMCIVNPENECLCGSNN